MKDLHHSPKVRTWLTAPPPRDVTANINRLAKIEDVQHIAVLPDVHLAGDVCVGIAAATRSLIFPDAVGSDIGCGMITAALDVPADLLADESTAMKLLAELGRSIPVIRHRGDVPGDPEKWDGPDEWDGSTSAILPEGGLLEKVQGNPSGTGFAPKRVPGAASIFSVGLSDRRLEKLARRDGKVEFGTLGRGNHFLEFQADEEDRLWILIHSGSRVMGPAIRDLHLAGDWEDEPPNRSNSAGWLKSIDAGTPRGQAYLSDAEWARRYASASRRRMLAAAALAARRVMGGTLDERSIIESDHNHVRREMHFGQMWWVHRKGSASACAGEMGILPGSMGTASFHVEGRGCEDSLCSAAHGAGRAMSRSEARRRLGARDLFRQTAGVWIDPAQAENLLEESPAAYKDIGKVLRAQRDLVKVIRKLRPVLNYKGTDGRR